MYECILSIIIPVYNGQKSIKKCLNSILKQDDINMEIILVDDGSTDNTAKMIKENYSNSKIKYFYKKNEGVSRARNYGIKQSTGMFIMFVDVDDELYGKSLNNIINFMQKNTDIDCIMGSYYSFRGKKIIKKQLFDFNIMSKYDFFSDIENNLSVIVTPWSKVYRTNIILDNNIIFDADLTIGEDTLFNINYFLCCRKICTIDDVVYRYNVGGVASSRTYHENINEMYYKTYVAYKKLNLKSDFLFDLGLELMFASIDHYSFNCKRKVAIKKIEDTLRIFNEIVINNKFVEKLSYEEVKNIKNQNINKFYDLFIKKNKFKYIKRKIANCIRNIIQI